MRTADWYFDFVSPYSYLQCERLLELPLAVRAKPLVFAGLLGHWGQKGPAEMATKRRFTYEQVVWLARRDAVTLRFPPKHPFNPIRALRLAVALGSDIDTIRAIFRYIWREGGEFETAEGWQALCRSVNVEDGDARVGKQEVKDELRRNGEQAPGRRASSAFPRSSSTAASSGATTQLPWRTNTWSIRLASIPRR
jgi:2-hydroxychromene-2-carboxylate isomerase